MSLLTVIVVVLAVALALWLLRLAGTYLQLDPWLLKVATVAVVIIAVVFVCRALGVFALLDRIRI